MRFTLAKATLLRHPLRTGLAILGVALASVKRMSVRRGRAAAPA